MIEQLDAGLVVAGLARVQRRTSSVEAETRRLVGRARDLGLSWDTISASMGPGGPAGETLRRRYDIRGAGGGGGG